jgi:type I restriction enzyme S subunit
MSDWQEASLADLAEYINGRAIKPEECSSAQGIPIIRIKQINDPQSIEDRFCGDDLEEKNIARNGDLLFSWSATLKTILWQGPTGAINQHIFKVLPKEGIDKTFLHYLIEYSMPALAEESHGSTMKHIKKSALSAFHLQVPPLPEQKKIAEILYGIDRQILSIKSVILQAQKIRTAISKKLIGSIRDELVPLSEVIINHDSRRMPIKSEERALRRGPYRYFGASGVIDTIDDFLFDGCYILIGEDGANIVDRNKPLAFKVSGRFWVNNHAHVIQPRESCDVNFLTYYLESLDYTKIASGSAQPKITRAALDAIQVPLPPLEIQKKIGAAIESVVEVKVTAAKKEERLIVLRQALSADLLSGRKRVTV